MAVYVTISALYIAVSCLFLRFVLWVRSLMLGSEIGRRHPELVGPLWFDVVVCILWPLLIIGFFIYLARGKL